MSEESVKPLWPRQIEVIGGTGEFESGKTTFGITICPGQDTLVYDFEKSSGSYEQDIGFVRVDVPGEMARKHPKGYKPVDVFNWWIAHVMSIRPGTYRVIVADPASDIEQGLADYVSSHPREFGRSPGQYMKMSGLMWGDMKAKWKAILADIATRCETFYFTTHQATVWKGDKPSKERKAKGKETLFEMASLYLKFERKKDKNAVPSAIVLKSRLSKMTPNPETGEVKVVPLLPPRLPIASPFQVRKYMLNPPDYANLKPQEIIGEEALSDDERLMLKATIAEAERDTAMAQNEREHRNEKRLGGGRGLVATTSQPDTDASVAPAQAVDDDETTTESDDAENLETEETEDQEQALHEDGGKVESAEPAAEDESTDTEADSNAAEESETGGAESQDSDGTELTEEELTPPHGEQVHTAMVDARAHVAKTQDSRYPSPDSPASNGLIKSLNNTIERFIRAGGKQEVIAAGMKKRNPKAVALEDLTNGQAEDMEAALLRVLDGPHETPTIEPAQAPQGRKEVKPARAATKSR